MSKLFIYEKNIVREACRVYTMQVGKSFSNFVLKQGRGCLQALASASDWRSPVFLTDFRHWLVLVARDSQTPIVNYFFFKIKFIIHITIQLFYSIV